MRVQELRVEMGTLEATSVHYTAEENTCIYLYPEKSLLWSFILKLHIV